MANRDIFQEISFFTDMSVAGQSFRLPIRYRRLDTFFAAYGADHGAVKDLVPSTRLRPVKVWPGRAAITLNAFNYIDTDIGPYGEFSVGVPCFLKHGGKTLLGVYVHRLPVTTEIAKTAGIEVWGYPKFVCEMEFENTAMDHAVRLSLSGQEILSLRVKKGGVGIGMSREMPTFTIKNGEIIVTRLQSQAMARIMPKGLAILDTGLHEMGRELAGLGLSTSPIAVGDFLDLNLVLTAGESAGPVCNSSVL